MAPEYDRPAQRGRPERPLLFDGATGTELERRGARTELPLWSTQGLIEAPETLERVHRDYLDAGADALTACTFRTQGRTLARAGLAGRAAELTRRAVEIARRAAQAADRPVLVVGSAPPLEDCFRPDLVPDRDSLAREHAEHAQNLAAAGVDEILAETHCTIREARAAAKAASDVGLPCRTSFAATGDGRLLSGESLQQAIEAVAPLSRAVAVNCLPIAHADGCIALLRASGAPWGVQPNLGAPGSHPHDAREHDCSPDQLASAVGRWLEAGASFVGGCCGTTPDHLAALRARIDAC